MTEFLDTLLTSMANTFNEGQNNIAVNLIEDKTLKWRRLLNNKYAQRNKNAKDQTKNNNSDTTVPSTSLTNDKEADEHGTLQQTDDVNNDEDENKCKIKLDKLPNNKSDPETSASTTLPVESTTVVANTAIADNANQVNNNDKQPKRVLRRQKFNQTNVTNQITKELKIASDNVGGDTSSMVDDTPPILPKRRGRKKLQDITKNSTESKLPNETDETMQLVKNEDDKPEGKALKLRRSERTQPSDVTVVEDITMAQIDDKKPDVCDYAAPIEPKPITVPETPAKRGRKKLSENNKTDEVKRKRKHSTSQVVAVNALAKKTHSSETPALPECSAVAIQQLPTTSSECIDCTNDEKDDDVTVINEKVIEIIKVEDDNVVPAAAAEPPQLQTIQPEIKTPKKRGRKPGKRLVDAITIVLKKSPRISKDEIPSEASSSMSTPKRDKHSDQVSYF